MPELRSRLLDAQFALQRARRPVVVIIAGMDGAGKGEVVHRLNEWLDPRGVDTVAFWAKTADEEEHPRFWRYWRVLP
ncbi:MAG: zeta toxin family protein, partial [Verrucomicrobiia bacterium]